MATSPAIRVFEPALCCATGVCGPELDEKLVRFTADIDYLKGKGVDIERHNLAVDPVAFASDETVRTFLQVAGSEGLPLTLVDGVTVAAGAYPTRERLARMAGLESDTAAGVGASGDAGAAGGLDPDKDLCCTPEEAATTGCCSDAATPVEAIGQCCSDASMAEETTGGCCSSSTTTTASVRGDLGLTPAGRSGCC